MSQESNDDDYRVAHQRRQYNCRPEDHRASSLEKLVVMIPSNSQAILSTIMKVQVARGTAPTSLIAAPQSLVQYFDVTA